MLIYTAVVAVKADVTKKEEQAREHHNIDKEQCRKDYIENECHPTSRRPALEKYCLDLEKCIAKSPDNSVHSSHMTAELIAKILNGFIEGLETRTAIFMLVLAFG